MSAKRTDYGIVDRDTILRGSLSTHDRANHNAKRRYDLRSDQYQWFVEALLFRCVTHSAFTTMLGVSPKHRMSPSGALVLRPGVRLYGLSEENRPLYTLSRPTFKAPRDADVLLFLAHMEHARPKTKAWTAHVERTREALTLAFARRALEAV